MIVLVLLLFIGGLLAVAAGALSRREGEAAREVGQRLERFGSMEALRGDAQQEGRRPSVVAQRVDEAVQGKSIAEETAEMLVRANLRMTVGEFLVLRGTAAGGGFVIGFLLGRGFSLPVLGLLMGVGGGVLGWMIPRWYLQLRGRRRTLQMVGQLGDTITLMANSLRAGYSLLQTMEMVSRESPPPINEEFRRVVREVGLGVNPEDAMSHMLRRVPSEDLDLLVTAINIQREVGGNLAQILDVIGETIRERVRIKGEIRVLTAQQSLSGYIISALPLALGGFMLVIRPEYILEMFVFPWVCLPIAGAILMIIGFLAMRKIVDIEV